MATRGVLAIDVGTSSVRVGLVDERGNVAPTAAQRSSTLRRDQHGAGEADPVRLLDDLGRCLDEACAELPGDVELLAVAMDTYWHSVGGVDPAGRPTTPIFTWADSRAADDAADLRAELDARAVHRRTGCVLHSSYVPAKLRWLARTQPETFAGTARWVSPGTLALSELCGEATVSPSMASGTGLLDLHSGVWDFELLRAVGIGPDQLATLSDAPHDGLREPHASRWPRLARVPWFPAVGDGGASNVGCGALGTHRAALNVGTSGALRIAWRADDVEVPEGLWCYRSDPRRFVIGSALSEGGNHVAWLREVLRLPEPEEAERAVAAMAPGEHGLALLPLLAGERGPGWADHAHGAVAGLSLATRPVDLLRATLEGIALRFALVDARLDAALGGDHDVVATGGGMLHSPAWMRIMADALGRRVIPSPVKEASARGTALLAFEALGEIDDVEDLPVALGEPLEPDPAAHAVYVEALERQTGLYEATVARGSPSGGAQL
jgi:gluconokinase